MDHLVEVLVACLAGVGAYFAAKAKSEAQGANRAVNHGDDDSERLYDLVASTRSTVMEVRQRFDALPCQMENLPCQKEARSDDDA